MTGARPEAPSRSGGSSTFGHVFIVGPARSGTSLLYKALCLHRDAAWISNWVRRYPAVPHLAALNRVSRWLPGLRRDSWFDGGGNAYVYGKRRSLAHRLLPMPVEGEPVFRRCGIGDATADSGDARDPCLRLLRQVVDAVRRSAGAPVFINKRIANNQRIPLLAAALPDARFVFIVRDGRAVAHSLSRVDWWPGDVVWWYGGTPRHWVAEGGDPWEIRARNWVEDLQAAERGLTAVPAQQQFRLRYEDLVREPVGTLERVAAFAGLIDDGAWRDELRRLRFPDRNEKWRHDLAPDVIEHISAVQHPALERYGYVGQGLR